VNVSLERPETVPHTSAPDGISQVLINALLGNWDLARSSPKVGYQQPIYSHLAHANTFFEVGKTAIIVGVWAPL